MIDNKTNYTKEKFESILIPRPMNNLFHKCVELKGGQLATWSDIFEGFKSYFSVNGVKEVEFPEVFHRDALQNLIKRYGFDLNHIDSEGDNLALYLAQIFTGFKESNINFDSVLEYVIKKTVNKNQVNHLGDTLPFYLCSKEAETKNFRFLDFLDKNPDIDLNHKNRFGSNLIMIAVLKLASERVIKDLMDRGVNLFHVNNHGNNFVTAMINTCEDKRVQALPEHWNLLMKYIREFKDPFMVNDEGLCFMEILSNLINDESLIVKHRIDSLILLKECFDMIIKKDYSYNDISNNSLANFFGKPFKNDHEVLRLDNYDIAKSSLLWKRLDKELSNKNISDNKKKIKI